MRVAAIAAALLSLASCGRKSAQTAGAGVADSLTFRHARLVHVYRVGQCYRAVVDDPWHAGSPLHVYALVPRGREVPESLRGATVVRTPVRRSVVFTSVHCGLLAALGKLPAVTGVCDARYVVEPRVRRHIAAGRAADMGLSMQPDVERIIASSPDALLVSPFEGSGGYGRLDGAGLPLIECADYMERSPLARAEWMRFYGLLYGCAARADSLFAAVESRYASMAKQSAKAPEHPTLMADLMQSGAWYVPGGESTIGRIFRDAGARYIFADEKRSGSVRLSFENVLSRARLSDVWIIRSGTRGKVSYASLRAEDERYAEFRPWRERKIYVCNTLRVPYFDEAPFRPDLMLADLVRLLHPSLAIGGRQRYFQPLSDNPAR